MQDPFGADLMRHIADEMSGPMSAAVEVQARPIDESGFFELTAPLREGAILIQLKQPTDGAEIIVQSRVTAPAPARNLGRVRFARWSDVGAALPLLMEPANAATELIDPVRIRIRATRDGNDIPADEIRTFFDVQLLSGRLAKLLYILQSESAAVHRHAHAIAASRIIENARGEALDRHGADLGVARFRSGLVLQDDGQVLTRNEIEEDEHYRERLALVRRVSIPRPDRYRGLEKSGGPLSTFGPHIPITIKEADSPFSAAISIIGIAEEDDDAAKMRQAFLTFLKDWVLVDPQSGLPTRRRMPSEDARSERAQRRLIAGSIDIEPEEAPLAPELAFCFEQLAMLLKVVGLAGQVRLTEAFAIDTEGSRHELGMGATIKNLSENLLEKMANAILSGLFEDQVELAALLGSIEVPPDPTADPTGRWLLEPCGFKTVHRLDEDHSYLSHTTVSSLEIIGERHHALSDGKATIDFSARFAPQGGGAGAALFDELMQLSIDKFSGASRSRDPSDFLGEVRPHTVAQARKLRAAGLPEIEDWEPLKRRLAGLPDDQWGITIFSGSFANGLLNGQAAAWQKLEEGINMMRDAGLAAAVPVFTADKAGILISSVSVPKIGFNISGKAATGVRWFVLPLDKRSSKATSANALYKISRPSGFETSVRFKQKGLYAVVALGYERRGDTDPYEIKAITTNDGDALNYAQYEYLMNLLALRSPIGVEINTWQLRQFHVESENGVRAPLGVAASRSFRRFRNPAQSGSIPSTPPIERGG